MPGNDSLVIVLDPGHGGENEGLKHRGLMEKDMNLVTAQAMRDELLQYDNVEVYITNPEKADMSLKERAQYAESVGADILISLHFNMSEKHEMFGSEVWIPSLGLNNSKMHSLGDVFMEQFDEMGFTLRGVKTRLNDSGLDYYGILRESTALGIQSILVEHGYADHLRDFDKVNEEADWKLLGISDATAVAKYFGLKSSSLGRDYSDYVANGYFAPEEAIGSDTTPPENALLVYMGTSEEGELFHISGTDSQSEIVYYDYSTNGGKTWSTLFPFENNTNAAEFYITEIPSGGEVIARVYNGHFLHTQTASVYYKKTAINAAEEQSEEQKQESKTETVTEDEATAMAMTVQEQSSSAYKQNPSVMYGCLFGVVLAILLIVTAFATYKERLKRKRMGREERLAGFLPMRRMQQIENICLLTGVCVLLLSITVFGISFVQKRAGETQPVQSVVHKPISLPEENETTEPEEIEVPVIPPVMDVERTEGYLVTEDGSIQPGDELLAQMSYNIQATAEPETVVVYDIAEGYLRVPLVEGVARNPYDLNGFSGENLSMNYSGGDGVKVMRGIDVSKFQGDIDWQQVKEAGIEFAILRLGIRGYGTGEMKMDDRFMDNYYGALQAGIKVGVYFFSAAINEEEAREEADYVLHAIDGLSIEMPVVFDTEPILYDDARTDDLTPNELTAITCAFCDRIRESGYKPMIYANSKRFTTVLHLEELEAYDKWLADYRDKPDYPYAFKMWQFTEKGSVPGIAGNVDIDLYFYNE